MARKFLRGLVYATGTNGRDIPIFMKLCYEFWAYCVNGTKQLLTVTAASNANPIQITTSTAHGLTTGQLVGIYGVLGNTNANGGFNITVVDAFNFQLNGIVGNANYTTGGSVMVPGGMPISPTSGPAGFFEGSSVLAIGNDGVTSAIGNTLTAASSIPFTQNMVGKHVVVWLTGAQTGISQLSAGLTLPQSTINVGSTTGFSSGPGTVFVASSTGIQTISYTSTTGTQFLGCTGGTGVLSANGAVGVNAPSTDDSIYRIASVTSNTQIQIIPFTGGTVDISTLKNNITSRASLSYRVIDVTAASQLAVASGNYFIGTMNGCSNINTGQASSQFQFLLRGVSATFGQFGMVASPNGSWNGSVFSGTGSNTTMTERITATATTFNGAAANVNGFVTMFADTDFFFAQIQSSNSSGAANVKSYYFLATTPQRLYTQAQDPNLIAILVGANGLNMSNGTDSFCTSFGMVGFDGITRSHQLISRNFVGDMANATVGPTYTVGFDLNATLGYQTRTTQITIGDGLIASTAAANQFSFARARIRPFKFTFGTLPQYYMVGNSGEFIHLANGLLMPWDGSILPYPILPGGT